MVKADELNAMVEWLLGNYAYGHLDEVPDWVLGAFLRDRSIAEWFAFLIYQVGKTKTDSPEELAAVYCHIDVLKVFQAQCRVRAWVIAERLRRMGKLGVDGDVLIKELGSLEYHGKVYMPDGGPFTSKIVEVEPGIVNIVGEEINLCGE